MTYDYKCKHCVMTFEVQRHIADYAPTATCPACGSEAEQYFGSERRFDVHFVGHEGWDSTGGAY